MRLWRPLVLLQCCAVEWASSSCASGRYASRIAFAGGFGAKTKKTKRPKPKKRRGGGGFGAPPQKDDGDGTTATIQEKKDGPVLDKWGLPPPTEEDIFPPMPPGTELIPADFGKLVGLPEIEDALKNHIDLDLHRFNEDATEKTVSAVEGKPMKVKLLHVSPPGMSVCHSMHSDFYAPLSLSHSHTYSSFVNRQLLYRRGVFGGQEGGGAGVQYTRRRHCGASGLGNVFTHGAVQENVHQLVLPLRPNAHALGKGTLRVGHSIGANGRTADCPVPDG